jgi:S-adenosylmethionine decarboxylase
VLAIWASPIVVKSSGKETRHLKPLGRHLLLDLFDCDAKAITSLQSVKTSMLEAARRASATVVQIVFHEFSPFGVSGVVVIAESHLAIHTWPEHRYAAVDIFTCGDVLEPRVAAEYLAQLLGAARVSVVQLERGLLGPDEIEKEQPAPVIQAGPSR